MRVYRIVNNDLKGESFFGLPYPFNQTNGEQKLNKLFANMKPWTQGVPYFKNSKLVFISKDALMTFLFNNKNIELTSDDIKELDLAGWKIESFEVTICSPGLSNFMGTYFNDEVIENTFEYYSFDELYNNCNYNKVFQSYVPKFSIKEMWNKYYTEVKTYYE